MYQGAPSQAVSVFAKAGFPCPPLTNPAGAPGCAPAAPCTALHTAHHHAFPNAASAVPLPALPAQPGYPCLSTPPRSVWPTPTRFSATPLSGPFPHPHPATPPPPARPTDHVMDVITPGLIPRQDSCSSILQLQEPPVIE